MKQQQTILVVDDDPAILQLMRDFLEASGYAVQTAPDGPHAQDALDRIPIDCLVLDVSMPGQSGFDLCRQIRQTRDVPVLFLTARDSDVDKLRGLSLGADDYVVKSATPAEVVARVKAILRRAGPGFGAWAAPVWLMQFGDLSIDVSAREVRKRGQIVALTAREFDLLRLLAEQPRQVFTAEQLLERFWSDVGERHTVTVHMNRLRDKLEDDPRHPRWIVTVWGVGYRFEGTP